MSNSLFEIKKFKANGRQILCNRNRIERNLMSSGCGQLSIKLANNIIQ